MDESFATGGEASVMSVLPDSARIRWWRKLTSTHLVISRSGADDSLFVTARRTNTGLFKGAAHRRARRDLLLYDKPYSVTWSRSAIYKKIVGLDGEDETQWMLSSASLPHTTQNSPGLTPPTILKVQLISHDAGGNLVTVEFSDPDQMFDPNALPEFAVGDSIQVKVFTTGNDTSERAYIHFALKSDDRGRALRRPLLYIASDGAFEGSFRVREGLHGRGRHWIRPRSAVWVDVLTKETIYDTDPGKYAANGWGLPFRLFRPNDAVALAR